LSRAHEQDHENAEIKGVLKIVHVPESFKEEIVQRIFRNFLDIMVLRLVRKEAMWGYRIIKHVEKEHGVKLRHGALYPLLNDLERKGYLRSRPDAKGGRVRKIYEITSKGVQLLDAYDAALQSQIGQTSGRRAAA
jgi:PadR family transcriptional regulator PadR